MRTMKYKKGVREKHSHILLAAFTAFIR